METPKPSLDTPYAVLWWDNGVWQLRGFKTFDEAHTTYAALKLSYDQLYARKLPPARICLAWVLLGYEHKGT